MERSEGIMWTVSCCCFFFFVTVVYNPFGRSAKPRQYMLHEQCSAVPGELRGPDRLFPGIRLAPGDQQVCMKRNLTEGTVKRLQCFSQEQYITANFAMLWIRCPPLPAPPEFRPTKVRTVRCPHGEMGWPKRNQLLPPGT